MLTGIARALAKGYDFAMANLEAAVLIAWKAFIESESKNPDADAALKEGVAVNQGRLAIQNTLKTGDKVFSSKRIGRSCEIPCPAEDST